MSAVAAAAPRASRATIVNRIVIYGLLAFFAVIYLMLVT
jgi:hypothetical protein